MVFCQCFPVGIFKIPILSSRNNVLRHQMQCISNASVCFLIQVKAQSSYHIDTNQMSCPANQLMGFYVRDRRQISL